MCLGLGPAAWRQRKPIRPSRKGERFCEFSPACAELTFRARRGAVKAPQKKKTKTEKEFESVPAFPSSASERRSGASVGLGAG